ncbi:hypothetical protein KUTeg_010101 [Tegillarca granosa]|uniref:Spermatogenesis-associated protein 22 n=1 Tax=Tegillarca granosa TaxID=220873 RepID=A0ABQ9F5S2_TEGGR|nr:hypothetical protein KUTeg_010101 [Tegillarca granosa]
MQTNGRTVPAPIFNHRKRPRQAIMSDPQDAPKGPTTTTNMYQGYPGSSVTFNQTAKYNRTTPSEQKPFTRNYQNHANTGRLQNQQINNYSQNQQRIPKENNIRNTLNFQQNSGQRRRIETQTNETRQSFNQFYRSPPQRHTYKKLTNKPNRSLFEDCAEFEETGSNIAHTKPQSSFSGNHQNVSSTKPTSSTERTSRKAKVDIDNSLHVISTSIRGMQHWSKYKDRFPMLFEVYGIIDSALLRDKTCTGKEFVLRDEQDSIQCIFYEIDRQLPRLIRGQWHRCVGNFDSRRGQLKCVSVRPVTKGDERQMFKSNVAMVENYLQQMTRSLPEP